MSERNLVPPSSTLKIIAAFTTVRISDLTKYITSLEETSTRFINREQGEQESGFFSIRPPPPEKIIEYLNKHVVGQHAKSILSWAIYNHYQRIHNNVPPQQQGNNSSHRKEMAVMDQGHQQPFTHREPRWTAAVSTMGSDIPDSNSHEVKSQKSSILLLGPTGSDVWSKY
ncbi:hypothetical protein Cfor_01100 [Coptotermes formosanus]|uniref:Uncharacterized protein n=1 Tax=Coptotermes formosanus TaxID=36987 RepID=A0A6L2PRD5_COPFO|nr:hypothetical protein Cfor_01100 [Coptotermes formosanus]